MENLIVVILLSIIALGGVWSLISNLKDECWLNVGISAVVVLLCIGAMVGAFLI